MSQNYYGVIKSPWCHKHHKSVRCESFVSPVVKISLIVPMPAFQFFLYYTFVTAQKSRFNLPIIAHDCEFKYRLIVYSVIIYVRPGSTHTYARTHTAHTYNTHTHTKQTHGFFSRTFDVITCKVIYNFYMRLLVPLWCVFFASTR